MIKNFTELNSKKFFIHPVEGHVAIFPSRLSHGTECIKTDFNGDYTFGIVLTGGGSKLDGIVKTAFDVFNMPIKKGCPVNDFEVENSNIDIFDPRYATAIGLVKFVGSNLNSYNKVRQRSFIDDIMEYLKDLFKS